MNWTLELSTPTQTSFLHWAWTVVPASPISNLWEVQFTSWVPRSKSQSSTQSLKVQSSLVFLPKNGRLGPKLVQESSKYWQKLDWTTVDQSDWSWCDPQTSPDQSSTGLVWTDKRPVWTPCLVLCCVWWHMLYIQSVAWMVEYILYLPSWEWRGDICYNMVWTPTLCLLNTSDRPIIFPFNLLNLVMPL